MKTPIAVVLLIVVGIAGVASGYFAGIGGASAQTVTITTANTNDLVNYWSEAAANTPWTNFQLSRSQLVALLNSGNSSIYLIDVRAPSATPGYPNGYAQGHIPSAIKIIIVYCYTGQTGAQTMTVLRFLGYTAFNLSSGAAGWSNATRNSAGNPIAVGQNYPLVNGTEPGVWTTFNPTP
jgi:rhodanese-related sulfurtransferase